jgi:hypothetical protein
MLTRLHHSILNRSAIRWRGSANGNDALRPGVSGSALLAFLVSKFLSKFPGHVELRNAENEKGHSERDKEQIWTVVSKVVQTEPDEGHAYYH